MTKNKVETGEPKFPYTTEPNALRRLLAEIPKRPKPPKMAMETLRAWNVSNNNNARSAITVLKKLGLIEAGGEPTNTYVEFMRTGTGPFALGERVRETYKVLFESAHAPQNESNDELKKLFHIHSGGGDDAMRLQVQTFKVLSEYANFGPAPDTSSPPEEDSATQGHIVTQSRGKLPPIQVDLHIHLPENKTSRDYEAIIQDIARYIYGREIDKS